MKYMFGTKQGSRIWLNTEILGFICGSMTWLLLGYGMYATTGYIIIPWLGYSTLGAFHIVSFNIVSLIAVYSHIRVMTTDPGAVPQNAIPLLNDQQEIEYQMKIAQEKIEEGALKVLEESNNNNYDDISSAYSNFIQQQQSKNNSDHNIILPYKKYCRRCKSFKPSRAHHCSMCKRCIVKMDHHCPWVNNCVGLKNHKLFLVFLFWVFVTCTYSLLLILSKFMFQVNKHNKHDKDSHKHLVVSTMHLIFLITESILFGLFTICMMSDQLTSISTNQTQIDRLKNRSKPEEQQQYNSVDDEMNEICGTPNNVSCAWDWLLPIPAVLSDGMIKDKILGYQLHNNDKTTTNFNLSILNSFEIEESQSFLSDNYENNHSKHNSNSDNIDNSSNINVTMLPSNNSIDNIVKLSHNIMNNNNNNHIVTNINEKKRE